MPKETKQAVDWALEHCFKGSEGNEICAVNKYTGRVYRHWLVDFVTKYFVENSIEFGGFDFSDVKEHVPNEML